MNSIDRRLEKLLKEQPTLVTKQGKRVRIKRPKIVNGIVMDRERLWRYCQRTANGSFFRAKAAGVPHNVTAYFIESLFEQQRFRCAVSGLPLAMPQGKPKQPFCPSLDRIVPALGYVKGNVRIVCEIANVAMNAWGAEPLERLAEAIVQRRNGTGTERKRQITRVKSARVP